MADSLSQLLAAAANLDDTELAVALQGLLTRRPRARAALLNVWRAEECVGNGASVAGGARGAPLGRTPAPAAIEEKAGGWSPLNQHHGDGEEAAMCNGFLAEARGYAARADAKQVGTEHCLAAAIFALPTDSRRALGEPLYEQLAELLDKSSLAKALPGAPPGGEGLPCEPEVEPLMAALRQSPASLLAALAKLPDDAAATQLLEMAKIFAQRQVAMAERELPTEAPDGGGGGGAPAAAASFGGPQQAASLLARSRAYAAGASARAVGTEHVLAAALEAFPEDAERAWGGPLRRQLLELLEKSQLGPPTAASAGGGLPVSEDAEPLLGTVQEGGEQAELFRALERLPDSAAAIQLLEMAKIFAERA